MSTETPFYYLLIQSPLIFQDMPTSSSSMAPNNSLHNVIVYKHLELWKYQFVL